MNQTEKHWASVWGNAVSIAENRPESFSKNITLRYPISSQFAGEALRLTFDNYCGTEAITIAKTTVLVDGVFYAVTFGGETAVTIPAGENVVSDPVDCPIKAKSSFDISF